MRTRIRKQNEEEIAEANVLPVMNVMFLLIPALLLAMETASMAGIAVTAPRTSSLPGPETATPKDPLNLKISVNADGFVLEAEGQTLDPIAATRDPDGSTRYDFAALEATARELKATAPDEVKVRITAENDVEYANIIAAMDALRGSDCKLAAAGEEAGAGCYFWAPVIDSY